MLLNMVYVNVTILLSFNSSLYCGKIYANTLICKRLYKQSRYFSFNHFFSYADAHCTVHVVLVHVHAYLML